MKLKRKKPRFSWKRRGKNWQQKVVFKQLRGEG